MTHIPDNYRFPLPSFREDRSMMRPRISALDIAERSYRDSRRAVDCVSLDFANARRLEDRERRWVEHQRKVLSLRQRIDPILVNYRVRNGRVQIP